MDKTKIIIALCCLGLSVLILRPFLSDSSIEETVYPIGHSIFGEKTTIPVIIKGADYILPAHFKNEANEITLIESVVPRDLHMKLVGTTVQVFDDNFFRHLNDDNDYTQYGRSYCIDKMYQSNIKGRTARKYERSNNPEECLGRVHLTKNGRSAFYLVSLSDEILGKIQ